VETLAQLEEALAAGARMVLLDNMPAAHAARGGAHQCRARAILEISGGVTLDGIIGTLTKDVKATDFSMRLQEL
jgi:nicotinate-nucleotide pyrophosphorylase (carboxylating)